MGYYQSVKCKKMCQKLVFIQYLREKVLKNFIKLIYRNRNRNTTGLKNLCKIQGRLKSTSVSVSDTV